MIDNQASRTTGGQQASRLRPTYFDPAKEYADKPWARSARCRADWAAVADDEFEAPLPGVAGVTLRVRGGTYRRFPSTLDVNLFCMVAALIAMQKNGTTVRLGSHKDALSMVGYSYDSGNLAALKNSLDYLQRIRVTVVHGKDKRRLQPPFERVSYDGGTLTVTMDKGFYQFITGRMSTKLKARVPLPLPKDLAVQNFLFIVAASKWEPELINGEDGGKRSAVKLGVIAAQIGLGSTTKYRDLRRAMNEVSAIYARNKSELSFAEVTGATVAAMSGYANASPNYKRTKLMVFMRGKAPVWRRARKPRVAKPPMPEVKAPVTPPRVIRVRASEPNRWMQEYARDEDGRGSLFWVNRATGELSKTNPQQ